MLNIRKDDAVLYDIVLGRAVETGLLEDETKIRLYSIKVFFYPDYFNIIYCSTELLGLELKQK